MHVRWLQQPFREVRARHRLGWGELVVSLLAATLLWIGCASTDSRKSQVRPRDGIAEYREVTSASMTALHAALSSLATVSAQSNRCAPEVLSAFSAEMQRLHVDSLRLRAHAQAMEARGDAYFERWHEHLARVKDPEVRALAETQRPALTESFRRIKLLSQSGREAFGPFQTNLRKLRNTLELDPANLGTDQTRNWIGAANENGKKLEKCLTGIMTELDSMRSLITPSSGAGKPQVTR